jgi:hypothetical protein
MKVQTFFDFNVFSWFKKKSLTQGKNQYYEGRGFFFFFGVHLRLEAWLPLLD